MSLVCPRSLKRPSRCFITNDVTVDSQRDSCIRVPQLPLHDSRSCTICEQGTGRTVPQGIETAAWDAQLFEQGM